MKQGRFGKIVLCLALVMVMSLGMMTTVLADGSPISGTESNPAQAAITKRLDMPLNITTPSASFTFTVAKKSFNNGVETADLNRMPAITDKTVSFTAADTTDISTTDSIKSVAKQVNLFQGVTFDTAGIYTYTVKEKANTYTTGTDEKMTYSLAEYEVTAYVANKATTGTYIKTIAAKIVVKDNPGQTEGDKVDPTPQTTITGTATAMVFTNDFLKIKTGGTVIPTDPSTYATKVTKTVTGDLGDRTKKFTFSVNVAKPALTAAVNTTFTGYIFDKDGTKGSAIEFTYGTAKTVELAHNEQLLLADAYIGSTYTVGETTAAGYTPSYIATQGGTAGSKTNGATTGTLNIKEGANSVDYTNDYAYITPTGIIMNNLPYIVLILVAVCALAAFIVVKSRKGDAANNKH